MAGDLINSHTLLVAGSGFAPCRDHVFGFFQASVLVKYDQVTVVAEESISAAHDGFMRQLESGMMQNRKILQRLLAELGQEGFTDLNRWPEMAQGYISKTVHEIAHLLDGFFGIDSAFYNLIDDSHWVSASLLKEIRTSPDRYWLIRADGVSLAQQADRVPFLRRLGTE
ncbi:MAG: hypothetical protein HY885_01210 [Deltaproteobacteria bacterium]|nr:hypothetical protein [Deltaproteobacteria bacterium]